MTLFNCKSLLKANATLLPVLVAVKFVSVGSATPISTVSPALIAAPFWPLVCKLKPPFKVVISVLLVVMFWLFCSTFWLVVNSWPPFTASIEVAEISPALTLLRVVPVAPPPKVTLSLVVASSYLTAALSVAVCCPAKASNWPLFTTSFASVPASTPLILFVVLSITTLPTVTLSVVTPALLITVLPVVTLLTLISSAVPIVMSFPLRLTLIFLPFLKLTVASAPTAVAASLFAWILNVWFCRLVILLLFVVVRPSMLVIAAPTLVTSLPSTLYLGRVTAPVTGS